MASKTNAPDTSERTFVHSPGPWRRDGVASDIMRSAVIRDATGFEVAHSRSWINDQYEGNANLIAQAPEMFQVIQRLAEPGFIGETELKVLIQVCRGIVQKVI